MWDKSVDELVLDAATIAGAHRCINSRNIGTAASVPVIPFTGREVELTERQREVYRQASLDIYQVELLKRAISFLVFWDANVGGTEEFPLILHGDHIEAINLLNAQLSKLRAAAGILSEV